MIWRQHSGNEDCSARKKRLYFWGQTCSYDRHNSNQLTVPASYSTAVRPISAISSVALQMKLSEGENSSWNSIVMDGRSLSGSKDRTLDKMALLTQIDDRVDRVLGTAHQNTSDILKSIDELSHQQESDLHILGASLDRASAEAAVVSERQWSSSAILSEVVQESRTHSLEGRGFEENDPQAAVFSTKSSVETSLSATIISPLNDMISPIGPLPTEGLRFLTDISQGMKGMESRFAECFKQLQKDSEHRSECFKQHQENFDNHARMCQQIEMRGNSMPLTFIILTGETLEKLSAEASWLAKMGNFRSRKIKSMTDILWEDCRVVFFCPVTHKQVRERGSD